MKFAVLALISAVSAGKTVVKAPALCSATKTLAAKDTCTCDDTSKPDTCLTTDNTATLTTAKTAYTTSELKTEDDKAGKYTSAEKTTADNAHAKVKTDYEAAQKKWDTCAKAAVKGKLTVTADCETDLSDYLVGEANYKKAATIKATKAKKNTPASKTVTKCSATQDLTTGTCECDDVSKPDTCLTKSNATTLKAYTTPYTAAEIKTNAAAAKKETAAEKKTAKADLATMKSTTAAAKKAWETCSKAAVKAAKSPAKPELDVACEGHLSAYLNGEAEYKKMGGLASGGAVVGIIVGCCVGALVLGGCALWYFKYHKKGGDAKEFNHDDLYEAFVDNDQA